MTPFNSPQPKGLAPYWLREQNLAHEMAHLALLRQLEYLHAMRMVPTGTVPA